MTILFADVSGSTALGEALDPEDMRALLSRYYAVAKDVVGAHGGTVEKFIGDAVMAVFGLPVAHGDDAERALAAALELRDRVRADPKLGDRMPIRLGVNTGEVVATRDASAGDFLVTGDAVNVAARLQQAAGSWEIVCGERTARAADGAFAFEPTVAVEAKGKAAPVRAAILSGRSATRRRLRIPLIGRASELAQLELAAGRALQQRRPSLVSIVAPAGTGKTRLIEEFAERLPAIAPSATVATAQCLPYGQRLTYWPLRAVLFRLIGADEDATAAEARKAISRWLTGSDVEDPERIADLLATTVGAVGTEAMDRAALFAAWRTAFEVAASRSPLVIVFEDLHWSSDSLLDLVEFVMQPRGDLPVVTVALTRPELLDRRPGWGGGRRNYTSIALEPLPAEDIAAIVRHLLEASPPDVVERVVERSEGNPFYAGELVRSLMERAGSLSDRAAVDRALAALPDTVQATVLARLDVLPAAQRHVLQLGSVYGRSFRARGVAALAPDLAEALPGAVDELLEKDMIRSAGGDRYAFRHILIREVAYQTLSRAERARLHATAGGWLERTADGNDDAYAELIAFHFREAASLPMDDEHAAAEIRSRATTWLRRAAEVAIASAAHEEARRHLAAAIELASADLLPELHERLGDAYFSGEGSIAAYATALRLARERGRGSDQQLRVLGKHLMVLTRMQGSVPQRPSEEEMAALRADAAAMYGRATDETAIATYLAADSFFPFWSQSNAVSNSAMLDEAETKARRALEIAERLGDEPLQSAALDGIGAVAISRGDLVAGRDLAIRRTAMRDLSLVERMDAFSVGAWMSAWLGDLAEAERISERGAAAAQPGQAVTPTLHLLAWRLYALYLRGRWDEALRAGDQARQLWLDAGRISAGYAVRGFLAAYHAARGRRDTGVAERMREAVDEIAAAFGGGSIGKFASALTATDAVPTDAVRMLAERPLPSPDYFERALGLAADAASDIDVLLVEAALGRLPGPIPPLSAQAARAIALTRRDAAGLVRAREMFEAMDARPFVARTRYEHGTLVGDEAERAAGIRELERIGDVEQIERYEKRVRATT